MAAAYWFFIGLLVIFLGAEQRSNRKFVVAGFWDTMVTMRNSKFVLS